MRARVSLLGALLTTLAGCWTYPFASNYYCTDPDKGHLGPDGKPDPCHERDAEADAGPQCPDGDFVHWPIWWEDPTLLWFGPAEQVPECPRGPMTISYEGHADLVAPSICEVCTCEPPTGSCALPSTLTASTAVCGTPGAVTSFNAPTPWDGSCDSTTQTPSGAAHSLKIDPITMTENGCASGPPVASKIASLHWDTFARGCDIDLPVGPVKRSICFPDDILPPGFALCIFHEGEEDCPTDPQNKFTERHIFYRGVQDDRQCSACSCGAPTGSACTAMLSIYKGADLTCSGPPVAKEITISSEGPTCLDIQLPGQALGSKSAGQTAYLPGTCTPIGGDASGTAIPSNPATLCCRP